MIRRIAVASQRSQAQAAIRQSLNFRQWQTIDVDQSGRPLHSVFHQIDKVCSTRQKLRMLQLRKSSDSSRAVFLPLILKWLHHLLPFPAAVFWLTNCTACTIPG